MLVGGWLLASVIIFVTLRLLPGDVAQVLGGTQASSARVAQIREDLGLNAPLIVQYFSWLGGVFTGDLGHSIVSGTSISQEIWSKAQVTLPLTAFSLIIALAIALPLGVLTAWRKQNTVNEAVTGLSMVAAAVPVVWAGLLVILIFSSWLGWFPSQGFPRTGWHDPFLSLRALFLPALTVGLVEGAVLFRFVRSATFSALNAEHVRTAMSFGYSCFQALLRNGLPGVGLSVVSMLGIQVAGLLIGSVVVEQLFALPGLGRMLVIDVGNRDLIKVQSTLLVLTGLILVVGVLIDIVHRLIDPRLRVES
jgi:peptide/nickel transport system permease protein